ncbi:MAG: Unknown protein [uncultured Sulfurovum sp.]|uniref:Lipoprotein n=1 Tax=uncultured Sulfurovum sp. TaxID=269237 RepID=A0A6S6SB57_9BACT|nr:MAG: Unknown protein [uncultured Sulfurovum sp.]
MKRDNKVFLMGYGVILSFVLVGCGGDSSTVEDTADTESKSTYNVSGTVPGTLIEAFCKDGTYYKVKSTDDGTDNHPFTLALPVGLDCKFVMTTNEDDVNTSKHIITPLLFNNDVVTSSYLQLSDNLDLGYVPLATSGEGVQAPLVVKI